MKPFRIGRKNPMKKVPKHIAKLLGRKHGGKRKKARRSKHRK